MCTPGAGRGTLTWRHDCDSSWGRQVTPDGRLGKLGDTLAKQTGVQGGTEPCLSECLRRQELIPAGSGTRNVEWAGPRPLEARGAARPLSRLGAAPGVPWLVAAAPVSMSGHLTCSCPLCLCPLFHFL